MFDFNINKNGEFIYNSSISNMDYVYDDNLIEQIAINRINSVEGDWFNTEIGATLEDFLGEPNNNTTTLEIINKIKYALTFDGFISENNLYFIPKIDKTVLEIKVFIKKQYDSGPIIIDVNIDTVSGVII